MKHINKNTAPYLQLLTVKTRLSESPLVDKMFSARDGFCFGVEKDDKAYNPDVRLIWPDINSRWPQLSTAFSRQVDMVSGAFFKAVRDSSNAFKADRETVNGYLAGKTFSGTIMVESQGVTLSYSMSFDSDGDPDDVVILMLDSHGTVLAYVSPEVHFVARFIQDAAMDLYGREIDFFSFLVGAFVITDITRDYILFCRFADVRVNQVARPGSREAKRQAGDPDASVNYYPFGIRKIDMRYITTVIRDEEFGVRGHWRMQPYGPGRKQRRLRYISPFVKHGYHRRAGILAAAGTTRGRRAGA